MPQHEPNKILTCFYDLKVSPVGFDFVTFVIIADLNRRIHNCDSIHLVIVPNQSAGLNVFGHANDFAAAQATWRIFNMLIPIAGLIEKCHGITVCPFRDHAEKILAACEGPVYPNYYNLENPPDDSWIFPLGLMYGNLGLEIPSLTPPEQALEYVTTWINERSQGRRVIAITLREGTHNAIRNSDIEAWSEFVDWLDKNEYFPVILPDIERVMEKSRVEFGGATFFPEPIFNLQLRAAFYQVCYLNLLVGAGPVELMRYSGKVRYIEYKAIAPFELDLEPSHSLRHGLPPDGQYPFLTPYQKIVNEPETFDLIKSEFLQMVEKIEASPVDAFKLHKLKYPEQITSNYIIEVLMRYINGEEYFYALKFAAMYIDIVPKDPVVLKFLVDFIIEKNGISFLLDQDLITSKEWHFTTIKESFLDIHNTEPNTPSWIIGIAMLELGIGKKDEAAYWLEKARTMTTFGTQIHAITMSCLGWYELNNDNFEKYIEYNKISYQSFPTLKFRMQLVLALEHSGKLEEAIEHLTELLESGNDQDFIHRKIGLLLKQTGKIKEAVFHLMKSDNLK